MTGVWLLARQLADLDLDTRLGDLDESVSRITNPLLALHRRRDTSRRSSQLYRTQHSPACDLNRQQCTAPKERGQLSISIHCLVRPGSLIYPRCLRYRSAAVMNTKVDA